MSSGTCRSVPKAARSVPTSSTFFAGPRAVDVGGQVPVGETELEPEPNTLYVDDVTISVAPRTTGPNPTSVASDQAPALPPAALPPAALHKRSSTSQRARRTGSPKRWHCSPAPS